ncbi:MAG: transcription antitermination factor NusB [Rhodobacteraceae bacterium]|nr:transcription antitermination factor NusB [Paracoccaceae bacterium]
MSTASPRRKKSAARLYAVQALFQMEATGVAMEDVRAEFLDHRFGARLDDIEWLDGNVSLFESLLTATVRNQAKIDQMTDRALVAKWPIDRIDPTLRALFRVAGGELTLENTPPKVVINEFVDLAKAFFPQGREAKFVNAVLDHMAREVRPDAF